MYRLLLKSMNLGCSGGPRDYDPRRSCREGLGREPEREPSLESNLSDWPIEHNRSGPLCLEFYRPACGFKAVVLTISARYLGAKASYRNEVALTPLAWIGTRIMTTFDKREEAFEKKFALDEEQKFKAEARRNKLLGLWVADHLPTSVEPPKAYTTP